MSYAEEKGKPNIESPYAAAGTEAHEEMHRLLTKITDEEGHIRPFDQSWFDDISDQAAIMLDRVMTIVSGTKEWQNAHLDGIQLFSEQQLSLEDRRCKELLQSIGEEPLFGTTDVVAVKSDEIIIIDFKTGHGEPAKAENTLQTASYALMACVKYGKVAAWAYIVNPHFSQQPGYYFSEEALITVHQMIGDLIEKCIEAATTRTGYIPDVENCKYCKGNLCGTCLAVHQIVDKLANSTAAVTVRKGEDHPLAAVSDEDLCDLKSKATIASKAIKAIDGEMKRRCEENGQCGPFFLKQQNGPRKITDLNGAFNLAMQCISPQEFLGLCSVSVPALKALYAEKMKQTGQTKTKKEAEEQFDIAFDSVMGYGEDQMVLTKAKA